MKICATSHPISRFGGIGIADKSSKHRALCHLRRWRVARCRTVACATAPLAPPPLGVAKVERRSAGMRVLAYKFELGGGAI
jgi:hypothetical protein